MRHGCENRRLRACAMRNAPVWLCVICVLIPDPGDAQPSLDSLWPNADGLRWDYEVTLEDSTLPGGIDMFDVGMTLVGAPGTAQVLHLSDWLGTLLRGGDFMKTESSIGVSQPQSGWSMLYLTSTLSEGFNFEHEAWPGDPPHSGPATLHATVEDIDAVVQTPFGERNAVRIRYVLDHGWTRCIGTGHEFVGRFRDETRGYINYVPNVGPVYVFEQWFSNVETDSLTCPGPDPNFEDECCLPPEILNTVTLSLKREPTLTGVSSTSWTAIKRRYR